MTYRSEDVGTVLVFSINSLLLSDYREASGAAAHAPDVD